MRLLNIHISEEVQGAEKFDTLIAPSGTVATLNAIARSNGLDHMAYDGAFPNARDVKDAIHDDVERTLIVDQAPVLLFTTLVYNAESTLKFIAELKREFKERVKLIVGGQLVPFATNSYIQNPNIDAACLGDGEALIPQLVSSIRANRLPKLHSGWLSYNADLKGQYSFVDYENFYQLQERMLEQKRVAGLSQLSIQGLGGPGCSWAAFNKKGACDFCALQNITEMNTQSPEALMAVEKDLQDRYKPDRLFDVSNQFLPFNNRQKNIAWLKNYIKERRKAGVTTTKYAYLTVGSIDEDIASLLKEAGIVEVYLGIDHFDPQALKEENKSHRTQDRLEKTLNALKSNGIYVRMGLVVGSASENEQTLNSLRDGITWLNANYNDILKAVGVFPIYVLPGSKVYERAKKMPAAQKIIESFEAKGYFTDEEEIELSKIYIKEHSTVSPEEIFAAIQELQAMVTSKAISYDYRKSPGASVLKAF